MRTETRKIMQAFLNGKKARAARTSTDGEVVLLHGNRIAERRDGEVWMTLAGWGTTTTRERLNGLLELMGSDARVVQRDHQQWIKVGDELFEIYDDEWFTENKVNRLVAMAA